MKITFHGDRPTGCAAAGLCGYAGTDTWEPGSGTLALFVVETHGHRKSLVDLTLSGNHPVIGEVRRRTAWGVARSCRDAQVSPGADVPAVVHGAMVTIRMLGEEPPLLGTLCAGPLDGDVQQAVPIGELALSRLRTGGATADFTSAHAFAAHGFAGTVTSNVMLRTGKLEPNPARRHSRPHTEFRPGAS